VSLVGGLTTFISIIVLISFIPGSSQIPRDEQLMFDTTIAAKVSAVVSETFTDLIPFDRDKSMAPCAGSRRDIR
jgi:hypothetical protein